MEEKVIRQLELLSPAGDSDSLVTAIANGADAVYLGLSNFNARGKAQNFSEKDLREHIETAHFYGVKVYITLNTLLQNNEFNDMFRMIKVAISSKVDAFIVQDLGICYALVKAFPNIVLHASTQMGIHNLHGARQAERLGITRIVLSRETKLSDIMAISKNTNLELECFVQGALCVAFSGNCYLSSKALGCSGNRGLCKQPCRMSYSSEYKDRSQLGYFLSARDLCLIDNLAVLVRAGVTSFKIEGRLRRAGYVAVATACYRKAIDDIKNLKTQNQRSNEYLEYGDSKSLDYSKVSQRNAISKQTNSNYNAEKLKLAKAFNRGDYLENAYLDDGVPDNVIAKESQNHQGVRVGKVLDVKPFKDIFAITLSSGHKISQGDGLKFFDGEKEVTSLGVGSVKMVGRDAYTVFSKAKAKAGQSVNLILDSVAESTALAAQKFVPVEFSVKAKAGENLRLSAKSGDVEVMLESEFVCEKAINKATDSLEIQKQIEKTADSGFKAISTHIETDGVFLPKSVLNSLRREVLELLKEKIVENNEKHLTAEVCEEEIQKMLKVADEEPRQLQGQEQGQAQAQSKSQTLTYVYSNCAIPIDIKGIVAILPNAYTESEVAKLYKLVKNKTKRIALDLPIIANAADLKIITNLLTSLKANEIKFEYLVSNNLYGLQFAELGYKLIAGFGHNVYNNLATHCLKELGASKVVESVENEKGLSSALPVLRMKNFKLSLMTFAHCPYKTVNGNTCKKCSYNAKLTYAKGDEIYELRRTRLSQCYFALRKME